MLRCWTQKRALLIGTFFILFQAIGNLIRFLWNIPIIIGKVAIPGWTSGFIFILLGLLAAYMLRDLYFLDRNSTDL